jgi:hypothetical protein
MGGKTCGIENCSKQAAEDITAEAEMRMDFSQLQCVLFTTAITGLMKV